MKGLPACTLALAVTALSVSCGIESYAYLSPVTDIVSTFNSNAVISLPSSPDVIKIDFSPGNVPVMTVSNRTKTLGTDYEIYYKIYLSDKFHSTVNIGSIRNDVNPALQADWAAFEPYTVDSNNGSSYVSQLVANRKYYSIMADSSGNLLRSNGNGAFNPKPSNRFFIYDSDLADSANLNGNINADIAGMTGGSPRYAYVSMYIVMRDFNEQTLAPVFSAPAFINVFLLPSIP
ncbi:MAG: hypothetical protein LBH50_03650 [Spirochaetaceae bacterium]|jgi:hypothetical protein|nr:hypothetical protein [Spirochaetaceae bacterium]